MQNPHKNPDENRANLKRMACFCLKLIYTCAFLTAVEFSRYRTIHSAFTTHRIHRACIIKRKTEKENPNALRRVWFFVEKRRILGRNSLDDPLGSFDPHVARRQTGLLRAIPGVSQPSNEQTDRQTNKRNREGDTYFPRDCARGM